MAGDPAVGVGALRPMVVRQPVQHRADRRLGGSPDPAVADRGAAAVA
ncbi:MAG: hypothetical protein AVDCRST_MAG73-3494 [uncultured Thermomicrobiales bacterium]|uniref:Uncharacterized protein n=1 Tax=uncultured Thermomicrobiales bacterium TaxID=1645740 RepID=A0A6J4UUI5_9BACT|nr:MAG: hypothetical protein AVDCRST_MAG73-3494 [uncultured Thermomicrobiales bacterium]